MNVQEEYAGQAVKCQACGTVLQVPATGAGPAPANLNPVEAGPAPAAAPGLWAAIERGCRENRLDVVSRNLFAGGLAALLLLAVSTFFSWLTLSLGPYRLLSAAGIQTPAGVLTLLLSLGAAGFAVFAFFQKPAWFVYAVYGAAIWGGLMFLYLLLQIFRAGSLAGGGVYLGVLAALGVGAAFGALAYRQHVKK
jgi:hypothetical protein